MRFVGYRWLGFLPIVLWAGVAALVTACSVYERDVPDHPIDGSGAAGSQGHDAGQGGAGGIGGSATGGSGTGGTSADANGATDAGPADTGATSADTASPLPDALRDGPDDALETGSRGDDGSSDTLPPSDVGTADVADASTGTDAADVVQPPMDASSDPTVGPDADARASQDADSGKPDAADGGPTGPQILPMHGSPIEKPDAGAPFNSRCASDEVITGFIARAGVQTDAIGSTCSKLMGGVLSSPRNLPLNGFATGGNAVTVTCPANYVAVGIVGRYGHNTMWMEDVTTTVGLVCKDLASTATQTVTITTQPALDAGYTSFREDCTGGRYLTNITGRPDSNSLGYNVQQFGGECELR